MKHKVEEIERVKEERRKEKEAEEEREMKELRKKAIPKANEVPEWYAGAPRKLGSVRVDPEGWAVCLARSLQTKFYFTSKSAALGHCVIWKSRPCHA